MDSGTRILDLLDIAPLFQKALFGDSISRPKPDPEMAWTIMRFFRCGIGETVLVGDMPIDVDTGKNAGISTFAFPTGSSTLKELEAAKPDRIFPSLRECLDFFRGVLQPSVRVVGVTPDGGKRGHGRI